jgi:hypothetical protein
MIKKLLFLTSFIMSASVALATPIVTESTNNNTSTSTNRNISESTSTVKSPPPTAVAPSVTSINNDVCAVVASGAVQTQIFGVSMGGTMRDMNCERIKLSKNLFDMGMKVAAVATLCQDERVFSAMLAAGTPCPVDGKIGAQAKEEWDKRGVPNDLDKKYLGYYAVIPKSDKQQCGYTGDDPVVMARVCGNGW